MWTPTPRTTVATAATNQALLFMWLPCLPVAECPKWAARSGLDRHNRPSGQGGPRNGPAPRPRSRHAALSRGRTYMAVYVVSGADGRLGIAQFAVLAVHLIQGDGVPARLTAVGGDVVLACPATQAQLLDEVQFHLYADRHDLEPH